MDPLAIVLSGAALLVSIWAASRSHRIAGEQARHQERLVKLETARERDRVGATKRASLRARFEENDRTYLLTVWNEGAAEARAVSIIIDGRAIEDHETFLVHREEVARVLGPDADARYVVSISMGSPAVYSIELRWEDDSGEPGQWRADLRWQ